MKEEEERGGGEGFLWLIIILLIFGPVIGAVLPHSSVPRPVCPSGPFGPFVCLDLQMVWVLESYWWLVLSMLAVAMTVWAIAHFLPASRVRW